MVHQVQDGVVSILGILEEVGEPHTGTSKFKFYIFKLFWETFLCVFLFKITCIVILENERTPQQQNN